MPDGKPHARTEERSNLRSSKARLFRDDGETEIAFVGLDLSTQGLGVLIRGDAAPGETIRLLAERIGEITLQVVWSRRDLVRPSFSHVGMKAADPSADLRAFFSKVFVAEEVEPEAGGSFENVDAELLSDELVMKAVQGLNADDPSIFRKANLSHLENGFRAYPFVHESVQYAVIVPTNVNTNTLRKGTVEQAGQHIKIFALDKIAEGSNLYRSRLTWPKISGSEDGPILVVEDDEDLLDLLKGFLKKNGFSTLECQDGKSALSLLKRHPEIRAVVTDLKMPGMDGMELIATARQELKGRGGCPPFIIVSGYVTPEVLKQGKRLGVSQWFVKPVETEDLLNALGSILATKAA